ncbi:AIR synthase-related protein [Humisphaera borealis]|uniref:Phosphoribosylformylglycinamidine cyclo-ligase n=1 Tax=Humisphaera borealis TaxID=2807512 RepID=A0A7M2WPD4_9BACT|nr:AIR synthase-related protein [Humisphaera borealis]QOV87385.1 phosphoribosylformylglycinamidine cyclo-ligase [Humisphaera borealis]
MTDSASPGGLSYESAGVNYDQLDAFKRACQQAAGQTVSALAAHGLLEPAGIRGESAYLLDAGDHYLAHVEEGLGTKNLIADDMLRLTGRSFYANVGIDTVATIVNDLITVGAVPISVAMHAAVGDAAWFEDPRRSVELAKGFAAACLEAGAVWGGGETPTLRGIVNPSTIVLAGSAIGRIKPKSLRVGGDVRDGDAIVFLASSGVQTNGLTLCRKLADGLADGYLTPLSDGRTYGEALLDPSVIYVKFVSALQRAGVPIHYAVHVTGHGWRKLMRLVEPFVYRIRVVREPQPVFRFIQRHGPVDEREAYATFNMGVGFAVYVDPGDVPAALELAKANGYDAWVAGEVCKQGDRKAVEIEPLNVSFEADSLKVR